MNTETISLLVLRGATVVAGALFLAIAVQAYRKHRGRAMLWLMTAISLMVVAAAAELVAFLALGAGLGTAEVIEAALTLVAFLVLLWSVRRQPLDEVRDMP